MSRRLRSALRELRMARGRPGSERLVLDGVDASNWRKRNWRRLCEQARIADHDIKDLRDTFASQLLTAGVHVAYVSQQLGHATWAVTAAHYARWVPKPYVEPMRLASGEVPPDLLARLTVPSQADVSENVSYASVIASEEKRPPRQLRDGPLESWSTRPDSNRRPSRWQGVGAARSDAILRLLARDGMRGAATSGVLRVAPSLSVAGDGARG